MIPTEPPLRPDSQPQARPTDVVHLAAGLLIAAIVIAALHVGQAVLIPLAIAFLISFALGPLVQWLVRHRLPRTLAVALTLGLVLTLLAALGTLVTVQVRSLSADLPGYQSTIQTKIRDLGAQMAGSGLLKRAIEAADSIQKEVAEAVSEDSPPAVEPSPVRVIPEPQPPFRTATQWLTPLMAPAATMGIVLVFVVLMLLDQGDLRDRLLRVMGGDMYRSTDAIEEASSRVSRYLLMQLVVNTTYAIPMALGLWAIGVPGWLLWGTLAAVMRFIPYVGPILSAVFPLGLAFAVDPGWNMVLMALALIVVLELISNNIVEPLLYGTSTGLSVLSLIFAATFWTAIWGPVGLVLSTPLTVCLLVFGRHVPQLAFLETLLGSSPALSRQTRIYQRIIANDPDDAFDIAAEAIEESSVIAFYDGDGMAVLRQISLDYTDAARAEHRLRIANGIDELLEEIREDYPASLPEGARPLVACIAGKWEIDRQAGQMLAHSLALEGIPALVRAPGSNTARHVAGLELEGVRVAVLGFFNREPDAAARNLTRRIRARWPQLRVVVGLWGVPPEEVTRQRREALGADAAVASIREAVGRVAKLLEEAGAGPVAPPPAEPEAGEAAEARPEPAPPPAAAGPPAPPEDLDALAIRAADVFRVRTALIVAVEGGRQRVLGASRDLPGARTGDLGALDPREAIARFTAQLLAGEAALAVADVEHDPLLADDALLQKWAVRALAAAPIRRADSEAAAALYLLHTEVRSFTEAELRLLQTLAAEVSAQLAAGAGPADAALPAPAAPGAEPAGA